MDKKIFISFLQASRRYPDDTGPDTPFLLSRAQQRLWRINEEQSDRFRYNMSFWAQLDGPLDAVLLEKAINAVAGRHATLRTVFLATATLQMQQTIPAAHFHLRLHHIDISNYGEKEMLQQEIIDEEHTFLFNLQDGPLLRAVLVRHSATRHLFMLSMHPLIADSRSLEIVAGEIFTCYQAGSREQSPLSAPDIRYSDFVAWQNRLLQDDTLAEMESFWMNHLSDSSLPATFPPDFPDNNLIFHDEGLIESEWPATLVAPLHKMAAAAGVDMSIAFVSLVCMLLNKLTGTDDITIGTVFSPRKYEGLEHQVGLYDDVLPVRILLDAAGENYATLLEKVRSSLSGAADHGLYPYEMLEKRLFPASKPGTAPIIKILVQSQHFRQPGMPAELVSSCHHCLRENIISQADMAFHFRHNGDHGKVSIEYNTALYKRATVNRIAESLGYLAAEIANDRQRPIQDFLPGEI
nr:condensation domain-containing protein [uncultured Chitinophaga sp.]